MRTLSVFFVVGIAAGVAFAQQELPVPGRFDRPVFTSSVSPQPRAERPVRYKIPGKRASQYTPEDWGALIDSTWGPGQDSANQVQVFDTFWNLIDRWWACFPNMPPNIWDSLRNEYRPQIGSGLSRGRFYGLMSRMRLGIMELHTRVIDWRVDTTYGWEGWGYPSTFHYRPGVPLLITGTYQPNIFGAAVTPLPDSTNLVYRAAPGNPLGLVPGDLVLGYEGVPWKQLYRQVLDAGLPVSFFNSWAGTTPESQTHFYLMAVGHNWGLFDTIDVVKYSTGDTLHLPTALLDTTVQTVWESDQVPVAGVPLPQGQREGETTVSWGVVQGTNIGYIYAWDWASVGTLFRDAIVDLRSRRVEGLIIDFRMNWGGGTSNANTGFNKLFNFDYTSNFLFADRTDPNDHMGFTFGPPTSWKTGYLPSDTLYDRPIAVLIGPGCFSSGDHNASRIRFHPMVRLFGKPTDGAFVTGPTVSGNFSDPWRYYFYTRTVYSNMPGEGYLIHKGVQPDETVWLTRDGVANGEDDVVKRALAWMDSLAYAHDVLVNRDTVKSSLDSIHITARVENPGHHTLAVSAIVTNALGAQVDSVVLVNELADTLWGVYIRAPLTNGRYNISVRTEDLTAGNYRRLPNVGRFTSKIPSSARMICSPDALWSWTGEGDSTTSTLTIGNFGGTSLDWSITTDPAMMKALSWLSVNPSSGTNLPGNQTPVTVTMRAVQPIGSIQQGSLMISSNDTVTGPETIPVRLSVFRTLSLDIPIEPAWNILSVPLLLSDYSKSTLFPSATTSALRYQPGTGYVGDSILANGLGYWLKFPAPETQPMAGFEIDADTFSVQAGWNIIGSISSPVNVASIGSIPGGIVTSPFYTFGTTGYEQASTVTPGRGYWVRAGEPGLLVLSSTPPPMQKIRIVATGEMPPDPPGEVTAETKVEKPREFALGQNYPNPFNPVSNFEFRIPQSGMVELTVFDILGRTVVTLVNEQKEPGVYTVQWDASGVSSGVYFYRLKAGDFVQTRRMLILR
jgi:hypothetical protein